LLIFEAGPHSCGFPGQRVDFNGGNSAFMQKTDRFALPIRWAAGSAAGSVVVAAFAADAAAFPA
jgi:hypothetical protein